MPEPDAIDAEAAELLADRPLTEEERVIGNRLLRLLELGFDLDVAEELARDRNVDVHVAASLLAKGATHLEAYKILA